MRPWDDFPDEEQQDPVAALVERVEAEIEEERRTTRRLARFDSITARTLAAIGRRPAPEAAAIRRQLARLGHGSQVSWNRAFDIATSIVLAGDRTLRRRASDKRTDAARRVLVGARVPRVIADEYSRQAAALGWSMYRWTVEALHLGYQCMVEGLPIDGADQQQPPPADKRPGG